MTPVIREFLLLLIVHKVFFKDYEIIPVSTILGTAMTVLVFWDMMTNSRIPKKSITIFTSIFIGIFTLNTYMHLNKIYKTLPLGQRLILGGAGSGIIFVIADVLAKLVTA